MKLGLRAICALLLGLPLLLPVMVLADTGSNSVLVQSAGTYYVTQVGEGAIARVVVSSTGAVHVDNDYIKGLPGDGPDSAVFAADGTLLASNFSDGSVSRIDLSARKILTQKINKTSASPMADLAFDPSSNSVWAITFSGTGPDAIVRVDLNNGNTALLNPDALQDMGGIAITETGSRVFVSTHGGTIAEIDRSGHVVRKITVQGSPDGLSYDPSTGYLYAAGCSGICEIATGGASGTKLTYLKTYDAVDGDGIAADGNGHVYVAKSSCGSLCRLDLKTNKAVTITDEISAADDVVPLTGAGAGGTCKTLGSCFDGAAAAGLAAASVGLVVFMGAAGFSGLRSAPLPLSAAQHGATAHATAVSHIAATAPHTGPHPVSETAQVGAGPPGHAVPQPPAVEQTTHLQEEAGDKLLEAGGAGIETTVGGAEAEALGGAGAAEAAELGGAARVARDKDEAEDETPQPPPPEGPRPPDVPQPPELPQPPEHQPG